MEPVLVVGATGQLGTAVVDRLRKRGARARALVRPESPREFESDRVELAFGDLREPESLAAVGLGSDMDCGISKLRVSLRATCPAKETRGGSGQCALPEA